MTTTAKTAAATKPAPARTEPAPAKREPAPAKTETAPAKTETAPAVTTTAKTAAANQAPVELTEDAQQAFLNQSLASIAQRAFSTLEAQSRNTGDPKVQVKAKEILAEGAFWVENPPKAPGSGERDLVIAEIMKGGTWRDGKFVDDKKVWTKIADADDTRMKDMLAFFIDHQNSNYRMLKVNVEGKEKTIVAFVTRKGVQFINPDKLSPEHKRILDVTCSQNPDIRTYKKSGGLRWVYLDEAKRRYGCINQRGAFIVCDETAQTYTMTEAFRPCWFKSGRQYDADTQTVRGAMPPQ